MTTQISSSAATATPQSKANILVIAAAFFVIGIGFVYVSGFANADVLHNGAHDSRHSLVFPCH